MKTGLTILITLGLAYAAIDLSGYHIVSHDEKVYRERLIKLVKSMNETQDRINTKLGVK
jgi:hypothetical protein